MIQQNGGFKDQTRGFFMVDLTMKHGDLASVFFKKT